MNNLVTDLFDKSTKFNMAIFCTYSLNLKFFEEYILHLKSVSSSTNISIFTDKDIYNSFFDEEYSELRWINKKYLLTPIDTKGVFHPKIYLFASDTSVRIGIGSSNITREGIANNLEIVSIFEVNKKDKIYSKLLKEILEFIKQLSIISKSNSAIKSIDQFIKYTNHLIIDDIKSDTKFFHNLNEAILPQIIDMLKEKSIKEISIISPYYDKDLKAHLYLKKFYPGAKFKIYLQQEKTNFPVEKFNLSNNEEIFIYEELERYIHGKAIVFVANDGRYLLTGSTNYTNSALLSKRLGGNIEASIFGKIDNKTYNKICKPQGLTAIKVKNVKDIETTKHEIKVNKILSENKIPNWLFEVLYHDNKMFIYKEEKINITPKYIVINDNKEEKIKYQKIIDCKGINKNNLNYAYIEGLDKNNNSIKSNKVWVVNLNKDKKYANKERFTIEDPLELPIVLKELIENGNERELMEYLLRFDIPLDLVRFNIKSNVITPFESKGNLFGELTKQRKSIFEFPKLLDGVNKFLEKNINKLYSHYNNIQLNKLDNFMFIYVTIFNMMDIINDYIIKKYDENPIDANDWIEIRKYYNIFLKYIDDILHLLWSNKSQNSFERLVNKSIKKDKQDLLGNTKSFKEYLLKSGYSYDYKSSLESSLKIIEQLDMYIDNFKLRTIKGEIRELFISKNGIKDIYINNREKVFKYIHSLYNDFKRW